MVGYGFSSSEMRFVVGWKRDRAVLTRCSQERNQTKILQVQSCLAFEIGRIIQVCTVMQAHCCVPNGASRKLQNLVQGDEVPDFLRFEGWTKPTCTRTLQVT